MRRDRDIIRCEGGGGVLLCRRGGGGGEAEELTIYGGELIDLGARQDTVRWDGYATKGNRGVCSLQGVWGGSQSVFLEVDHLFWSS